MLGSKAGRTAHQGFRVWDSGFGIHCNVEFRLCKGFRVHMPSDLELEAQVTRIKLLGTETQPGYSWLHSKENGIREAAAKG